jgi:small subunit ribosomal protein S7
MPRKYKKQTLYPDPVYGNAMIAKLINHVMRRGKKATAQKIVYRAFDVIQKETQKDPLMVFDEAMKNASPLLEVRSKRVGGATYQVPQEVKGEKKNSLAMRWILNAARSKKGKPMADKLAEEIIAASKNTGSAVKKKEDTHRMAEANRAFAHFSW